MEKTNTVTSQDDKLTEDVKRFAGIAADIHRMAPSQIELVRSFMAGLQAADAINEARCKASA